jgi:hypothetical protein
MTEDYTPTDELPETPVEAPPPPPPPRTRSVRRPAAGGSKRPSERPRKRPSKPAAPVPGPAETVKGLLQIPGTADGATILVHGPTFANAIEEWAKVDPRVAVILERLVAFGPASAVAMALVIMGAQFARNHNEEAAPILSGFGAVSAPEIIAAAGLEMPVEVNPNGQVPADGAPSAN